MSRIWIYKNYTIYVIFLIPFRGVMLESGPKSSIITLLVLCSCILDYYNFNAKAKIFVSWVQRKTKRNDLNKQIKMSSKEYVWTRFSIIFSLLIAVLRFDVSVKSFYQATSFYTPQVSGVLTTITKNRVDLSRTTLSV